MVFFSIIGGWTSGALGVGGSSVYSPAMVWLGVPPVVSSSTAMYMIMYSTSTSSIVYLVYGSLNLKFALWLALWSSIGTIVGSSILYGLIKKYRRQSLLLFVVVAIQGTAMLLIPINSSFDLIAALKDGKEIWKLTSFCE